MFHLMLRDFQILKYFVQWTLSSDLLFRFTFIQTVNFDYSNLENEDTVVRTTTYIMQQWKNLTSSFRFLLKL